MFVPIINSKQFSMYDDTERVYIQFTGDHIMTCIENCFEFTIIIIFNSLGNVDK